MNQIEYNIQLIFKILISTDTIRQVMRLDQVNTAPALYRTSYLGSDDPIVNWLECCDSVQHGIDAIVDDSIKRGTSLVLQGVLIKPDTKLIDNWKKSGGIAIGTVLSIQDENLHKQVITSRGVRNAAGAKSRLENFNRIRAIHDETVRLAEINNWLVLQQTPSLRPQNLDILNDVMRKKLLDP